jgi:hypothetical protein
MNPKYSLGADPELFVMDIQSGVFVSGHGLIPGTKTAPHPVPFGGVQVDGMALEFNIDPVTNRGDWLRNVDQVRQAMARMIAPTLALTAVPVATFDPDYIRKQPDEATELGCNPDFNAWLLGENPPPVASGPFRTAAGHVHIGWQGRNPDEADHFFECVDLVRHLDNTVGLATVILDPDQTRRSLYGKAGAFRPKPYGVEYRVPSNFWLQNVDLTGWMYDAVEAALNMWDEGDRRGSEEAQTIINNGDAVAARAMLPEYFPIRSAA